MRFITGVDLSHVTKLFVLTHEFFAFGSESIVALKSLLIREKLVEDALVVVDQLVGVGF